MSARRIVGSAFYLGLMLWALSLLWAVFVWTPVYLWTEGSCLERGMAHANVTFFLGRYCTNLDGAVTVRVEKL